MTCFVFFLLIQRIFPSFLSLWHPVVIQSFLSVPSQKHPPGPNSRGLGPATTGSGRCSMPHPGPAAVPGQLSRAVLLTKLLTAVAKVCCRGSHAMFSSAENVNYLRSGVCVVSGRGAVVTWEVETLWRSCFNKVPTTQLRNHSCPEKENTSSTLDLLLLC